MRLLRRLTSWLSMFNAAVQASAAVEFAIVAPVALLLYVGAFEVSDGTMTSRTVSVITRNILDILSQQPTSMQTTSTPTPTNAVTASTLADLMTGAQSFLYPKSTTTLAMTLTAVDVTNTSAGICCNALVRWSYTMGGTLRPCATQLTGSSGTSLSPTQLPSGLLPTGSQLPQPISYLISDVSYTYQPLFGGGVLPFSPTMSRTEYMMPRTSGQVIAGSLPSSGAQHGKVCY